MELQQHSKVVSYSIQHRANTWIHLAYIYIHKLPSLEQHSLSLAIATTGFKTLPQLRTGERAVVWWQVHVYAWMSSFISVTAAMSSWFNSILKWMTTDSTMLRYWYRLHLYVLWLQQNICCLWYPCSHCTRLAPTQRQWRYLARLRTRLTNLRYNIITVSYTHLTLPTIYSV